MNLLKVDSNLKYLINEEIDEWEEGQSPTFKFPFTKLGIKEKPTESELEAILSNITYIDDLEVDEDEMLLVTVDKHVLKASYEARLQEWKRESDLLNYEYWSSRGVW